MSTYQFQYLPLIYLLILVMPLSCCSQKDAIIHSDPEKEIKVNLGESFEIELPTHPGTGFGWEIRGEIDETMITLIKKEYRELGDESFDIPGMDYFEFEALKKGITELTLWYIRPWKKDNDTNPDIKTEVFKIIVD